MTVGSICHRTVVTASSRETIRVAAQRMAANNVGTLVVLEPEPGGKPTGMITDRDIALRCVAAGKDPEATMVGLIMTSPVWTVEEYVPIEEAISKMARGGTRRLVVVGSEGALIGMLSLDDVLEVVAAETGEIGKLLSKQQAMV